MNNLTKHLIVLSQCLLLVPTVFLCTVSGCSQPEPKNSPTATAREEANPIDPQVASDLTKLTDGILYCLTTKNYQWLENYTELELSGPQVARLIMGDAAFDRNVIGWYIDWIIIKLSPEKDQAFVTLPVTHEARVDKKFKAVTTYFDLHFYYSKTSERWLLNFNKQKGQQF